MDFNPALMQQLLEQDLDIPLSGISHVRAEALKKSLLKKYVPRANLKRLQRAAFDKFVTINNAVGNHTLSGEFLSSEVFLVWKGLIQKALLNSELTGPCLTLQDCIEGGRQGPGVTNGNEDTLFFTKMFNSHMTTTSESLFRYYGSSLSPRWKLAEAERQQHWSEKVVLGSILSSVRKNREEDRTTCKEPTLNMFYQLGAKERLEAVLLRSLNIDIAVQQFRNRVLARNGSLDGSFATLDLRSASDSISIALCRALLPPSIFRVLMQIRSPKCRVGNEWVELNMIGTMGNGFTFALMTLMFGMLVKAVYLVNGVDAHFGPKPPKNGKNAPVKFGIISRGSKDSTVTKIESSRTMDGINSAVFGDDIIVLSQFADQVIHVLELSGFQVNTEKSFTEGPFRESCGGDYHLGSDVRGIYIKKMENEAHVYSAFNRLMSWSCRHGIPLPRTLRFLMGSAMYRTIPIDHGIVGGFVSPVTYAKYAKSKETGSFKFEALVPLPEQITRCGERFMYHNAGLVTHLGGYITNDIMTVRSTNEDPQYIVKTLLSPFWDGNGFAGLTARELELGWDDLLSPT